MSKYLKTGDGTETVDNLARVKDAVGAITDRGNTVVLAVNVDAVHPAEHDADVRRRLGQDSKCRHWQMVLLGFGNKRYSQCVGKCILQPVIKT